MEIPSIAVLLGLVVAGRFVAQLLGKGVASALQIGAAVVLGVMLLRHFPEAIRLITDIADRLWPAIKAFGESAGRHVADTLKSLAR